MEIKFTGAARCVTGSRHLITTAKGKKILLDCGLFQDRGAENDTLNRHFAFNPAEVDYLILSHAHTDHSGNIPSLVKQGFAGTIFCTPPTFDLCEIMLMDSAHIQEHDIAYVNKKRKKRDQPQLQPIYTATDVANALKLFKTVSYNKVFKIDEETSFWYTDSGHILGSAAINLEIKENEKTIHLFFSGDIGRMHDLILKAPQPFPQADYILCESTYGNKLHDHSEDARKKLLDVVMHTCFEKKGKLIIPAFSLGRTQEIVYSLDRFRTKGMLPPVKVYVDSPLSVNATDIMRKHSECFNNDILVYMKDDPDPFGFNLLTYIQDIDESKALNDSDEPCIIISASGMLDAGRIKHHVKNNIGDARNTILIVGYCTPASLGGRLTAGVSPVHIFGNLYDVKAQVEVISSYSAHADYGEMIEYLSCQDVKQVKKLFLVHGDFDVQLDYKIKLEQKGFNNIEIPAMGDSFILD